MHLIVMMSKDMLHPGVLINNCEGILALLAPAAIQLRFKGFQQLCECGG